jgi:hypothetical protein
MSNAFGLGVAPGMTGNLNIIESGLMSRHGRRPNSRVQTGRGPCWLATVVTCTTLMCGGAAAQDAELIEKGRQLFMEETFGGNGRTCATCHPPTNNFTIDPEFIRTLKGTDPLFLTGPSLPDLKPIEVRRLLRNHALFLENVDGLDQPGVLRSVPHTLALRLSLQPDIEAGVVGVEDATGWSGDGSPGDGSLRNFATGAVIQHFTKRPQRVPGVDFRLPEPDELEAMEAFQLSLGRQGEVDILSFSFADDFVEDGKALFQEAPSRDGEGRRCSGCHHNAGAIDDEGVNRNRATGANLSPNAPACLLGFVAPYDGGFGTEEGEEIPRAEVCGKGPKGGPKATSIYRGDMSLNTPPLIEAADTPPFFHNNSAATIEDAVAFYTSDTFNESITGGGNAFVLSEAQVNQIAAFLRAMNARENIRSSNAYDARAIDPAELAPRKLLVDIAIAETTDAIEVLTEGPVPLFADTGAVQLLREAQDLERQAVQQDPPNIDLLEQAIARKEDADAELLAD